jgi:hypothetical protein
MVATGISTCAAAALVLALASPASPADAGSASAAAALDYARRHARELEVKGPDVAELSVSSEAPSARSGVTHVYLQQSHRGIAVHNALLTVSLDKNGRVISTASRLVSDLAALAGGQMARLHASEAVRAALRDLRADPRRTARPIETALRWLPLDGAVRLAWKVEIEEADGSHSWVEFIDAETGEPLAREDLVVQDSIAAVAGAFARPAAAAPAPEAPSFADLDGSSYNVFALPFESPNDGGRTLATGAAEPAASPCGWHDTDGVAGPEFTITRGNNVHAYTDIDANNVPDPGSSPDGGSGLDFDFPLDLALQPDTYRPFAVTNLFYWNNIMHDVTLGYGFDEASGNFQVRNYSGAIGGGDDVRAEAQDGSGTNNANFSTPAQNAAQPRPRMQMFVWTHPRPNVVRVTTGGAAGDYEATGATFGPRLPDTGPIPGAIVLVDDGVAGGTVNDGCEPFTGVAGKLALLERGFCTFSAKAFNAQNAGALGVIVANNVPGLPVTMGFTAPIPAITIPSVMISLADSTLIRANLPASGILQIDPTRAINRDSDLDSGVIAHEYGHGISNRLTGGPNVVNCLQNAEQMGEGWSDWFALNLTSSPADTALTARGVGNYLNYEGPDGNGIRPTPYSTDMTVDPATYASVADPAISLPHGIGYVWNSMLWEVYWNLVDRYGYHANLYDPWTAGGNNLALQLVMDGLKFQPCSPGFVDGRDAILAADRALTAGANQCEIWRGFAKRGLGFSASQGLSTNRFDGVPAFDLPAACRAAVFGGFRPPIYGPPVVNVANAGSTVPVKFSVAGGAVLGVDSQAVGCDDLVPTGEAPAPVTGLSLSGGDYRVNWRTDADWSGTCRRLTVRIPAPADAVAYFRFH